MLAQKSGLDPDSIRNACRGATRADGSFDARSIDSFSQWALRKKYVDTVPPAESLMEASLLAEARA